MTYAELIGELFPRLTGGIRWGLERTRRLLAAVGDPHRSFRSIHIGGTNGKGSVSATMSAVLNAAGTRVGLYTSPHLCTFRERVQVAGAPVEEEAIVAAARSLWPAIEREGASFFEAATALAFLSFAEAGVETAIVEVGLGGRLDSTNLIDPELVVLTNVAVDHVDYLGGTIEAIAEEKAGIIKTGAPVLTGESDPDVVEIFRERAAAAGASFRRLEQGAAAEISLSREGTRFRVRTTGWGELELRTPLIGEHQAWNTALAVTALDLLPPDQRPTASDLVRGVAEVRWPGRMQIEEIDGVDWIFDVAHNAAGVGALRRTLGALPVSGPLTAVVGIMRDKDWRAMLGGILEIADHLILTVPPSAPPSRVWDPEEAIALVPDGRGRVIPDLGVALREAGAAAGGGTSASNRPGSVLVTGSFHTVGDALALLGRAPWGTDPALPMPRAGV